MEKKQTHAFEAHLPRTLQSDPLKDLPDPDALACVCKISKIKRQGYWGSHIAKSFILVNKNKKTFFLPPADPFVYPECWREILARAQEHFQDRLFRDAAARVPAVKFKNNLENIPHKMRELDWKIHLASKGSSFGIQKLAVWFVLISASNLRILTSNVSTTQLCSASICPANSSRSFCSYKTSYLREIKVKRTKELSRAAPITLIVRRGKMHFLTNVATLLIAIYDGTAIDSGPWLFL